MKRGGSLPFLRIFTFTVPELLNLIWWKIGFLPYVIGYTDMEINICFMTVGAQMAQWARSLDLTTHTSLSRIRPGFAPSFVNNKKGCTRLATASDKVYQLLAHGQWFSPSTPASSTTKTGRHDIAEILLKLALKHQKWKSNHDSDVETTDMYWSEYTTFSGNFVLFY